MNLIALKQIDQVALSGFINQFSGVGNNTGILSGVFYPLNSNPSGYLGSGATGNFLSTGTSGCLILADPNRWTDTLSGETILNSYDATNGTYLGMVIAAAAGNLRSTRYSTITNTGLLKRWAVVVDSSAESGGSHGSDFYIARSNDNGNIIDAPLFISRVNGYVQIGDLNGTPNYQLDVNGIINTLSGISFQGTGNSLLTATGNVLYINGSPIDTSGTNTGIFYPLNSNPSGYAVSSPAPTLQTSNFTISNGLSYQTTRDFICNGTGLGWVTGTLPTIANTGDVIRFIGISTATGCSGFAVGQKTGQYIYFGNATTTTGVTGALQTIEKHNTITLYSVNTGTLWSVIASQGNFNVI